jgi:electron transfer flavoprotein alpha subunit
MKILAFVEQRDGQFKKAGFEAMKAAATLAGQVQGQAMGVVVGDRVKSMSVALGGYGAMKVFVVEDPRLKLPSNAYAEAVAQVAKKEKADVVLFPATSMGKDLAPRVAVKLDAGLAADCTSVRLEGGNLVATRPVFAGKALTDVTITSAVKILTLRPNVFSAGESTGAAAPVEEAAVELTDMHYGASVKEVTQASGKLDVAEADIIVSGGRGLKGPEHFTMIEELASVLGGAVGASRAVVDAGWRPHDEQVGQTGKTVSPSLYIAIGISGAIQHLAGMSSSKYIVAINKDKDAPIFQVADYGIAGDAFEVVPALTKEVRKLLGK